jgi:FMN phosphatase YigB (HAD superfamily)
VRLIIIDVAPALLSWEGRGASDTPEAAANAEEVLDILYARYRLAAVTDGDRAATELRDVLERLGLDGFFESIGTSADFGPRVSPQVIRRIARALRAAADHLVVVTARPRLARSLEEARIAAVLAEPGKLSEVPDRLRRLTAGRPHGTTG